MNKRAVKETTDWACVAEEGEVHHEGEGVAGAGVGALLLYVVISSPRGAALGEILVIFYIRASMDRLYKNVLMYIEEFFMP